MNSLPLDTIHGHAEGKFQAQQAEIESTGIVKKPEWGYQDFVIRTLLRYSTLLLVKLWKRYLISALLDGSIGTSSHSSTSLAVLHVEHRPLPLEPQIPRQKIHHTAHPEWNYIDAQMMLAAETNVFLDTPMFGD